MKKAQREEMWETFKVSVIDFIKENGIGSMLDIYNIAKKIFPRIMWCSSKLEELSNFLIKEASLFQIDLAVPYHKPVIIYPGHHACSSTSFFVSNETSDDHVADVEKAKNILEGLTNKGVEISIQKRRKKKGSKTNNEKEQNIIDIILQDVPDEEDATQKTDNILKIHDKLNSKELLFNGFIPLKRIHFQILHLHIFHTFGTNPFTIDELMKTFSFDLYTKIIGVKKIPKIFLREPKLRHILVSCFPKRIKDMINYEDFEKHLNLILRNSSNTKGSFFFLAYHQENNTYQQYKSITYSFFNNMKITFTFNKESQVIDFHKTFQILNLMENVDPHSCQLWFKRYSMERSLRNRETQFTKVLVESNINESNPDTFPYTFPQVEKFIGKLGLNWIQIQKTIEQRFPNIDKKNIKYPKTGPISDFCDMKSDFEPNLSLLFDKMDTKDFMFLKNLDKTVIFNYLSAISTILPNGFIGSLPRPWTKIIDIIHDVTDMKKEDIIKSSTPFNYHTFLLSKYRDYRDLYFYTVSSSSYEHSNFNGNSKNLIELTTNEYYSLFNILNLRFRIKPSIGELIERLKIISLCSGSFYINKKAKKLLNDIDHSDLNEAVFFLKLSKFLNQKLSSGNENSNNTIFKCSKKTLSELSISLPIDYFKNLKTINELSKNPDALSRSETNNSSCTYFLDDETPVSIELLPPKISSIDEKNLSLTPNKSSMSVTAKKIKFSSDYSYYSTRINYPNLPDFTIDYQQELDTFKKTNYMFYEGDYCNGLHSGFMHLFVLIYQTHPSEECTFFILICRFLYGFIIQHFSKGVSLEEILKQFNNFDHDIIYNSLSYLEEFGFIYSINSNSIIPIFVSDIYGLNHMIRENKHKVHKQHFWIRIDGTIDKELKKRLMIKASEIVYDSPGIELLEITNKMPALTLQDLILILDTLETDEVIYSNCYKSNYGSLFDESVNKPIPKYKTNKYLYHISKTQFCFEGSKVERHFYPTSQHHLNLSFIVSN